MKNTSHFIFSILACTLATFFHSSGKFIHNGITKSQKSNIMCDEISGTGSFEIHDMLLRTEIFSFTGTIKCSNICIIEVEELMDFDSFTMQGQGDFVIINNGSNQKIYIKESTTSSFNVLTEAMPEEKRIAWFNVCVSHEVNMIDKYSHRLSRKDIANMYDQLGKYADLFYLDKETVIPENIQKIVLENDKNEQPTIQPSQTTQKNTNTRMSSFERTNSTQSDMRKFERDIHIAFMLFAAAVILYKTVEPYLQRIVQAS